MRIILDFRQLFEEVTEHLLSDEVPSNYINKLSHMPEYAINPLQMLWKMKTTEQSKLHHPEGSVWNHTMMVLDEAAKLRGQSKNPKVLMWAALLHDIGKPSTTRNKNGKITSYDHDSAGEKLCIKFLEFFTADQDFITEVAHMVRYHMHMLFILKNMPFADKKGLSKNVDPHEIALLCKSDRLGRTGSDKKEVEQDYERFLQMLLKESK
ncbi:MAG: HDIG domain-containing protein [Mobilitalea sp.]